jgi:cytochrome c2
VNLSRNGLVVAVSMSMLVQCGCTGETETRAPYRVAVGDSHNGSDAIRAIGCGSCHTIPGIRGADGMVGPPLVSWSRRTYIGGQLPNTPANLVRWLRNPREVEPGTAMPVLGLDERQARDVAAYLYTLR